MTQQNKYPPDTLLGGKEYVPSYATNIRETFRRVLEERAEKQQPPKQRIGFIP